MIDFMFPKDNGNKILVTGDTHGDWSRLLPEFFPYGDEVLTNNDYIIVCGDFGIWHDNPTERYWLNELEKRPFTTVFVDGNHENFDRLYGDEFPEVDYCGGKAHKIRNNVYHLERGYVFEFCGKKFFCFGGAASHDISDGILDPSEFSSMDKVKETANRMYMEGKHCFRVKGISWWDLELPTDEEMKRGIESLNNVSWEVDYVITHCAPQQICALMSNGFYKSDKETMYFNGLLDSGLKFKDWYFGHYHINQDVMMKFHCLYDGISRIL